MPEKKSSSKLPLKVVLVAGEVSGDAHGKSLVEAMQDYRPLDLFGIGGDGLEGCGMRLVEHQRNMAFMGVGEIVRHLPFIRQVQKKLLSEIDQRKPQLAILIDYPGFNLQLARHLKKRKIPVVYYISPKFWAWGQWRVKKIRNYVDLMLVLFPFEVDFYKRFGIQVHYVGNPVVDQHFAHLPKSFHPPEGKNAFVGVLPGSRKQEVERLLGPMLETMRLLKKSGIVQQAEILKVKHLPLKLYEQHLTEEDTFVHIAEKPMHEALPAYHAALVASGTATLETGYYGVPMVIVYKVSPITYGIGRRLIKIDKVGLINIVAGKIICPELIQYDFTPQRAAQALQHMLMPENWQAVVKELKTVRNLLGAPGASQRAAEKIDRFCSQTNL